METEIKYLLKSPYSVDDILSNKLVVEHMMPESRVKKHLKTVYYDTKNNDLDNKKAIYRLRQEDDDKITATVKISKSVSDGLHQRQEWNVKQDSDEPDIEYFLKMAQSDGDPNESITKLLSNIVDSQMVQICGVEFNRTTVHIGYSDTLIEFDCDEGFFIANRKKQEFFEIELELLEGNVVALLEFGEMLENVLDIVPENKSKFERSRQFGKNER